VEGGRMNEERGEMSVTTICVAGKQKKRRAVVDAPVRLWKIYIQSVTVFLALSGPNPRREGEGERGERV